MIRTRDFFLFVVIFVFILTGIVFTVARDARQEKKESRALPEITAAEGTEVEVDISNRDIDRAANLLAIREKILRGEGEISAGEPIFTSVDTPTSSPTDDVAVTEFFGSRNPQYCASRSYSSTALLWGSSRGVFRTAEGVRLVILPKRTMVSSGSSTVPETTEETVLQLTLFPQELSSPVCLDSEYVGVALDGSLIHNDEAWRYRTYASESMIGYARDGFPIYGPSTDEQLLDQCGGYNDGSGYRYHIRQNEMFVLGCYAGTPATFIDS